MKDTTPFVVLLTGGIGSGKSVASKIFEGLGITVVDMDILARNVVAPGMPALEEIGKTFGSEFICENGTLNRSKLRKYIFDNPLERVVLEKIMHARMTILAAELIANSESLYVLLVVPAIGTLNFDHLVSRVLVIEASEEKRISRVMKRDNVTEEDVRKVMKAQLTRDDLIQIADDTIYNAGNRGFIECSVKRLHKKYVDLGIGHVTCNFSRVI